MTCLETILANFRPRYMKKSDERRMFASWDSVFAQVQKQKIECGAVIRQPADMTELHRGNVVSALRKEHATMWTLTAKV